MDPWNLRLQFAPHVIFFEPADYRFTASAQIGEKIPFSENFELYSTATDLELSASRGALVAGGALGSLLWVLFMGASRLRDVLRAKTVAQIGWQRPIRFAAGLVAQAAVGTIVAVIAVMLLDRTSALALPVRVEVRDWLGGVLVGLSAIKLEEVLRGRFSS